MTTVESTPLEGTAPDQTPHCSTSEAADPVSNENYDYGDSGKSPSESNGGATRVPRGQYKEPSVPVSSCDIVISSSSSSSSRETSDDRIERVLAAVDSLCDQVTGLMKSMILMEERLTLIEDKTEGTFSSRH